MPATEALVVDDAPIGRKSVTHKSPKMIMFDLNGIF